MVYGTNYIFSFLSSLHKGSFFVLHCRNDRERESPQQTVILLWHFLFMKDIFSEYGWMIIAVAIVIIVLLFTSPLGTAITNNIMKIVTDFSGKVTTGINSWNLPTSVPGK